ncbi:MULTISPECIES: DUF1002 domain-containing protein [Cytobacillus]|jgi:uncharacterized protein YpuA (DUF1002 family)|uniref:Extracellular protein n=3 Tax=Cytobacillus TaxID=2675230 RepID=A0A160MDZ8_9BACI|nr:MULTISPECIES: DUF1002 domain-containing protein [Cytobacillus]EFV77652.1 hypothetical protein HMPREF1013_02153 [Bacillus sp. 2_A_57_CT2]MBY0154642.1 DUF1002 domain-containing protein [Cytobacillus firmus]AND41302.1 hypothetical protein A361_19785 [Cytobacillus oceanisediminis 2691]MBU8731431.1 DUF1002 domain-containing protein [Cytobacillus oceanisediminis]MCM3243662.1 DUF1002 domain-containing protein [Cytobacillus oceanisediminis]
MKWNKMLALFMISLLFIMPIQAFADMAEGDVIVTLGENLSEEQKNMLLAEMKAPKDAAIITVSNEEEHKYLGNYISKALIGTRAISSSAVTIAKQGSGLEVETKNINWVTDEMYINALITAGVKDAKIYITAPANVSGTAALTGIIKAYEISAEKTIPEEVKQAANEEMVETAKLGDSVGNENAAALIAKIKEEIAKNSPETDAELRTIIENAAKELGITLTEQEILSLIDLFNKLKELDIDWNQVGEQLNQAKDKISKYLESEEGQGFLESLKRFFVSVIDAVKAFFS